jgi:hypothetical protein
LNSATDARGKQRDAFEPRWWSGGLIQVPGGTSSSTLMAVPRMSLESMRRVGGPRARERGVLSGGLEVPAHVRVTSNGGSGEPSRVGCLWSRCSSRRRVVGWGATTLRRWVLHVNDPLGAALFAPLLPYQWWITSAVSIQARMWLFDGSCGRCLPPCRVFVSSAWAC